MRLAFVHANHFEFEARRVANPEAAETDLPSEGAIDGGLAVAVAVESGDLADPEGVAADAAPELHELATELDADAVAIYPAAHLVDDSADPGEAAVILRNLAEEVRNDDESRSDCAPEPLRDDFEVVRVPVGYDTAVEVSWKGHPTSEGSRRVTPETDSGGDSKWVLALADGRRLGREDATDVVGDPVLDRLDAVAEDSRGGYRQYLERHDFADSSGFTPRGTVVRDALLSYADEFARSVGATPVRPSPAVDRSDAGVELAFRGREPVGIGDGPSALDPGTVGPLASLSGRSIPEAAFPVKRFARNEAVPRRSEEGIHWVASPQVVVLEPDLRTAAETFRHLVDRVGSVATDLGLDAGPVVGVEEGFETTHPEVLAEIGEPVPLEVRSGEDSRLTLELGVVADDRFFAVASIELDAGAPGQFGIERVDGEGSPVLVRVAPVGDVAETVAAAVAAGGRRDPHLLPTWLSPTQVRVIPVGSDHHDRCEAVVDELVAAGIRAEVDDRQRPVGERIDRARRDWVPYQVVVGDDECGGADLPVAVRESGRERRLSTAELVEVVHSAVGDRPSVPARRPRRLSTRLDPDG